MLKNLICSFLAKVYLPILLQHVKDHPKGGWIYCPRWLSPHVFVEMERRKAKSI